VRVPSGVRATVLSRDAGKCARCNVSVLNIPASVHHRRRRGSGGTSDHRSFDPRNLVTLCGTGTTGCHGEVESYRALAYDTGWLIRSYDELHLPMFSKDGRRVTLTEDGGRDDVVDGGSLLAAGWMA
jgi:hypothetical protein